MSILNSLQVCNIARSFQSTLGFTGYISRSVSNSCMVGGTGNPYETRIRRRREVNDVSMPNFEKVECLKWTKWGMLRDVKWRHLNSKYWQYRLNMKSLVSNRTIPSVMKDIALEERNSTPHGASINHIHNRCAISARTRGIFHAYRLSRIIWRDQADHAMLSGPIRAKWG